VNGSAAVGAAVLFRLQAAYTAAGSPKGVLEGTFMKLYSEDSLPDAAFVAWKEDDSDTTPGKVPAVIATNRWFAWLAEQMQESEGDSEDSADESGDDDADASGDDEGELPQGGRTVNVSQLR
jgi:hypothetical protein